MDELDVRVLVESGDEALRREVRLLRERLAVLEVAFPLQGKYCQSEVAALRRRVESVAAIAETFRKFIEEETERRRRIVKRERRRRDG